MSTSTRAQVLHDVKSDDPAVVARQRHMVQILVRQHPEFQDVVTEEVRKEVREEERTKMRLHQARAMLRRVLARRGLVPSADDEARIDACTSLAALEHWHDEAVVASSVAEALGRPRQR
jgi:hypothetical protein